MYVLMFFITHFQKYKTVSFEIFKIKIFLKRSRSTAGKNKTYIANVPYIV